MTVDEAVILADELLERGFVHLSPLNPHPGDYTAQEVSQAFEAAMQALSKGRETSAGPCWEISIGWLPSAAENHTWVRIARGEVHECLKLSGNFFWHEVDDVSGIFFYVALPGDGDY